MRAFRHDFNNHILSLQALSANNDQKKLREYILSIGTYQENIFFFRTENLIADAITNQFAENLPANINFQVTGSFSKNTFLQDIDLCTILSNLLSNAKEAVLRFQASDQWDGEISEIILDIHETNDSIHMTVINLSLPVDIPGSGLAVTSKVDEKNHGFGLKNIKQAAEKYNGSATFFYENDQHLFHARVLLLNSKAI